MGCFSFMCENCEKAVLSNSFNGDHVQLWLLKDGTPIEHMAGPYDSYGRVFDDEKKSMKWKMDWHDICDLMFSHSCEDGIAAIHTRCWDKKTIPTTKSDPDPNQGWGGGGDEGDFFADTNPDTQFD